MIGCKESTYKDYTVAIETSQNVGTGFFIAPELVCTCYHVIAGSCLRDVSVRWKDRIIQVEDWSCYEEEDLAFLLITGASNKGWLSFEPVMSVKEGMKCYSFGFPNEHRKNGCPLLLTYSGSDINEKILSFSQDNVTPGASGSPIVFENTNSLVGMLSISRDVNSPSGGRGLSAAHILKCLCEDRKFYSYAIRMLQSNEVFSVEACLWSVDNQIIYNALEHYLNDSLRCRIIPFDYGVLMPYIALCSSNFSDNPYIILDYVIRKKFADFGDAYREWIDSRCKAGNQPYLLEAQKYLSNHVVPLSQECISNVNRFCKAFKNKRVAGSNSLSLGRLLEKNNDLFVFHNIKIGKDIYSAIETEYFVTKLDELFARDQNAIVLSNPGAGKSTLMLSVFLCILEKRIANLTNSIPIYIDLQKELGNQNLDFNWLDAKINKVYGKQLCEEHIGQEYRNIVLLLDGLDEYLSRQLPIKVNDFFNFPIFDGDSSLRIILSCRELFFSRYVQFNDTILAFEKIYLKGWSRQQKKRYVSAYVQYIAYDDSVPSESIGEFVDKTISNNPFLEDLTNTPLFLNMCIEVLVDEPRNPITNLIDLFDEYTETWICREYDKVRDRYQDESFVDQVLEILPVVNWKFYIQLGAKFTRATVLELIKSEYGADKVLKPERAEELADFIVQHTFFVPVKGGGQRSNLFYMHKAFVEYFTSKYVFDGISNSECETGLLIETHKVFLSHEISELIKEHFMRVSTYNPNYQRQIYGNCLRNCILAVKNLQDENGLKRSEKRMAQQQLIYHVGQIKVPEATTFLKQHLEHETNLWTRRTIILGLSFTGDESELDAYINRMQAERVSGGQALESEVNIGFSLSFFGDQPFDDLHPEVDQGHPRCKNTVKRLIQQLSAVRNRPSWHNDLYTLVDLADYRPVSKQDYVATIVESQNVLLKILNDIEMYDAQTKSWKEIMQMRTIIDRACKERHNIFGGENNDLF